ncbi:MAG: helix-turn-helix domain-containing protein [Tannerellaceae bacterium]|nr:helix-turn-helix domain-containing protein [Tannerellaceae bacterium]
MLREKCPDETNQARLLSDLLGIQENTIYRKFNGNRQFSLDEVVKIAHHLSVSVDTLLGEQSGGFSHHMELILTKNMSEQQRTVYLEESTRSVFVKAAKTGYSKFTAVCKNIPIISYCYFGWLMKFALLKWYYFNNCLTEIAPLTEMHTPDEFSRMKEGYIEAFNSFRRLVFIVDRDLIRNYTLELHFFQKIGYLTNEDIIRLLNDLESLLNVIEDICRKGYSQNPQQEIAVFYSDIALYNDLYLVESTSVNRGILFAQGFTPVIHKDGHTFTVFRDWADSCVRSSNPICGVADSDRKVFFEKQFRLVREFRNQLNDSNTVIV